MLEAGLITADDFRQFVLTNAASLHTSLNPDFFKGTAVEEAVANHVLPAQVPQMAAHGATGEVAVAERQVTVTAVRDVDFLMLPGGTTLDATATSRVTQERAL